MSLKFVSHADSNIGRVRSSNQDGGYTGYQLHFVADGMGGHAGGDIASAMVSQHVAPIDALYATPEDAGAMLLGRLLEANEKLGATVDEHPELAGMGTTFSGIVFTGNKAVIGHIGDSRIYLARDGKVRQVTKDHTFVQRLVDRGDITEAEALTHPRRNVLMRVLGDTVEPPNIDSWVEETQPGDRWMMCSDGLCGYVSQEVIDRNLLAKSPGNEVAEDLIGETLEAGAPDNVTVVVVDVLSENASADFTANPTYVGSAANDVVIANRRGRKVPTLLNPRAIADMFSKQEETTAFVPESEEFLAKVLAETNKRIRNRWLRQLLTYLIVALIAGGALWGGYSYTQTRYYVGEQNGHLTIFKGIKESLGGVSFSSVYLDTNIKVANLTPYDQSLLANTLYATSLEDAKRIVQKLIQDAPKNE